MTTRYRLVCSALACALLGAGMTSSAAEAQESESTGAERICHRSSPRLQTSDMVKGGFVVHYLENGTKEFVRMDYVFADRLYFRFNRSTWRAIYLAHPSAVIQKTPTTESIVCSYVLGFSIDAEGSRSGGLQWVFLHDAVFVETP